MGKKLHDKPGAINHSSCPPRLTLLGYHRCQSSPYFQRKKKLKKNKNASSYINNDSRIARTNKLSRTTPCYSVLFHPSLISIDQQTTRTVTKHSISFALSLSLYISLTRKMRATTIPSPIEIPPRLFPRRTMLVRLVSPPAQTLYSRRIA